MIRDGGGVGGGRWVVDDGRWWSKVCDGRRWVIAPVMKMVGGGWLVVVVTMIMDSGR